jgi:hypothetical protein
MVRPITVIFLRDDQLLFGRAEFFQLQVGKAFSWRQTGFSCPTLHPFLITIRYFLFTKSR